MPKVTFFLLSRPATGRNFEMHCSPNDNFSLDSSLAKLNLIQKCKKEFGQTASTKYFKRVLRRSRRPEIVGAVAPLLLAT